MGVAACTVGLVTGPLWARPVWGIWWTWDARLTTTFIMWLLYISYLLLRGLIEEPGRRATLSAVFGIFAFLDVPLVYVSNRLWRTQHPQPVILGGEGSGLDPTMAKVLLLCVIAAFAVADSDADRSLPAGASAARPGRAALPRGNPPGRCRCGYFNEGAPMKNFEFLFTAWIAVWAIFFLYEVSVARRLARLRDEIERLKQQFPEA